MDETRLIHDWTVTDGEFSRDASRHPHEIWFDDETLRDGLQSPSALNPSIEQKKELLDYMEQLGLQRVDLGLPGAGPFHIDEPESLVSQWLAAGGQRK